MAKVFLIQNDGSRTPITPDQLKLFAATGKISRDAKIEFGGRVIEVGNIKELTQYFKDEAPATLGEPIKNDGASSFVPPPNSNDTYDVSHETSSASPVFPGENELPSAVPPLAQDFNPSSSSFPYIRNEGVQVASALQSPQNESNSFIEVSPVISTNYVQGVARTRLRTALNAFSSIMSFLYAFWGVQLLAIIIAVVAAIYSRYRMLRSELLDTIIGGLLVIVVSCAIISIPCFLLRCLFVYVRNATIARAEDSVRQEILLNELLKKNQ